MPSIKKELLSTYKGKTVKLELVNMADGWAYEAACWGEITVTGR